jgi:alginate O-acetyltransferase complex protein AlgJ
MSRSPAGTTREEEALTEIAASRVAPAGAWTLAVAFLLISLAGATLEVAALAGGRPNLLHGESALSCPQPAELSTLFRRRGSLAVADRLRDAGVEAMDRLERDSQLAASVRPGLQAWLTRRLRYGNSQVLVGHDGWLFFRDDFDYLTGPAFLSPAALERRASGLGRHPAAAPDPLPALLGLAADLAARGVAFVVVPVPTKLGISWERFVGRPQQTGPALENPSKAPLLERLQAAGVDVFDPAPILRARELGSGPPPYMRFDSHWSPAGLDATAEALAKHLHERYGFSGQENFRRVVREFDRRADLADLLGLDPETNPYLHERLEIDSVDGPGERPYSSRRQHGPVLLVGDSFSRLLIRNKRKGGDANFAAALSFHLQSPVAMLAENDAGQSFAARVEWLRAPHLLDERQIVVLEVAERAFALGDWTPTPLDLSSPTH